MLDTKGLFMKIDKKAINYYYSFFEVSKELNQKQFYEFNMAIYKVMFFEIHINDVSFKDQLLTILWKSVKHSIEASVQGYCTKKSIPYDQCFDPLANPLANKDNEQGEEKGQEKEQGQIVRVTKQDVFTFSLNTQKLLSATSKIYQSELKEYIDNSDKPMSYEDFYNQCEMKPYRYKNFKMAYDSWNKENKIKSHQQPVSFKQQDEQRDKEKSDNISKLLNSGFNPFKQEDWNKLSEYETKLMQEHQQGAIDVQLAN